MRTIKHECSIESIRLNEKGLKEIGKKYLPWLIRKKSFKEFVAEFKIKAEDIDIKRGDDWIPAEDALGGMTSIQYTVRIANPTPANIQIYRDEVPEGTKIRVRTHTLTFSNNVSSMSDLHANVGKLVFSTVAKIVDYFVDTFSNTFQAMSFTPAQPRLKTAYEILSREAEREADLVYANKKVGRDMGFWILLYKPLWQKLLSIKKPD